MTASSRDHIHRGSSSNGLGRTVQTERPRSKGRCERKIFSTFDTRDLDKSQPDLSCGTHIITGGTGKYAGITGSEPFACNSMPALAGAGGYTAMDIPHNTSWEIKK
jgi:hypothetical protein